MKALRYTLAILLFMGFGEPLKTQYVPRWEVTNRIPTNGHLRVLSIDVSRERIAVAGREFDTDVLKVWATNDVMGVWTLLLEEPGIRASDVCVFFRKDARLVVLAVDRRSEDLNVLTLDTAVIHMFTECPDGGFDRSILLTTTDNISMTQRQHGVAIVRYVFTPSFDTVQLNVEIRDEDLASTHAFGAEMTLGGDFTHKRLDSLIEDKVRVPSYFGHHGGRYQGGTVVPGWSNTRTAVGIKPDGLVILWTGDSSMVIDEFLEHHITHDQYGRVSLTQRWRRHPDATWYHVVVTAGFSEQRQASEMRTVCDLFTRDSLIYLPNQLPGQWMEVSVRPLNNRDAGLTSIQTSYLPFRFRPGGPRAQHKPLEVTIIPNPATTMISVDGTRPVDKLTILDLTGAVVATSTDARTLDVSQLPVGTYTVVAQSRQTSVTAKLFVQR